MLTAALFALAFPASGAGEHDHGHGHGHKKSAAEIGEPAEIKNAARTVEIAMGDIYYEPKSVTVRAGESVHFSVTNIGRLVHEFTIGTADMHSAHKKEMLAMMQSGALLPGKIDREKMRGEGHSHGGESGSVLLEPGESGEFAWKFSGDARLEFACNIPGHYEAGMVGVFERE